VIPRRRRHGIGGWLLRRHHERGAALVLALAVLVGVSALALALLSISALEPQISRNHADMLRARYLAEAGIEHAYDVLARDVGSWSVHLAGATCTTGAALAQSPIPGVPRSDGEFIVRVRNDCEPGDETLTGVPLEMAVDAARDTNRTLIIGSTGAIGTTVQTITAVISYNETIGLRQTGSGHAVTTYSWADQ
jgi:Tfp pilus assembly protein PilX